MLDNGGPADHPGTTELNEIAETCLHAGSTVLDALAKLPAAELTDDTLASASLALERARRSLDAAELACLGELDRRGTTQAQFGQRTAAWLANHAKLPRPVAAARVNTAKKLAGPLAPVGAALAEGAIGFDHARVIADAANPRIVDDIAAVTEELCAAAGLTTFDRWQAEVRGLAEQLDADGGHDPTTDPESNRLSVHRVGGVTSLNGQLVGEGALTAETALHEVADDLFRRYTRDSKLTGDPVPRRPQLLAEAFAELCRRGLAVDQATSTPPRTEASVVFNAVEPDNVTDELGIRLDDTLTLLCDARLRPIVASFESVPLALGREQRFATPPQVAAIALRDAGCTFPGCDAHIAWLDTHHADEWADGGNTDVERMCGLCRFHHRIAHRSGWTLELTEDGWTLWTRPDGSKFWGQRHHRQRAGPPP